MAVPFRFVPVAFVSLLFVGLFGQPVQAQAPEGVERVRSRIDVLRGGPEQPAQGTTPTPSTAAPSTAEGRQSQPPAVTPRDLSELEARIVRRIEAALTEAFNRERLRALLEESETRQTQEYRPAPRNEERPSRPIPARPPPEASTPRADSAQGVPPPATTPDTAIRAPTTRPVLPDTVVETRIVEVERAFFEAGIFRAFAVNFAFGESRILPSAYRTLNAVGAVLSEYPDLRVRIEGHTDAVGTEADNKQLSEQRAQVVRQYLIEGFGVAPERLVSLGYGEARPVASNETKTGRELNRRVEFVLLNPQAAVRLLDSSDR